ncbi:hypothetical protein ACFPK9_12760 [Rubritalea spongiae]|uniref:Protein BatD n=1 Tax=Rubritalea spongiae TaxID=430797 RepID=A0ABW5E112_9BACT
MKHLLVICILWFPLVSLAQEYSEEPEIQLRTTQVKPEITTRSIFPDRLASAVVHFDTYIEQPFLDLIENDSCRIVNVESYDTEDKEGIASAAIIQFQVKKAGIATLPSITFRSDTKKYETQPIQFLASEPIRSDQMSLTITPTKTKVYVGEPVRFELTWQSSLQAAALQNLRLHPELFDNKDIEVAIPRNTDDENVQVGLPIGGRRTIATRQLDSKNAKTLGTITLPLYLRFNQVGRFELPPTKLEISKLAKPKSSFAQYVAHFNNSLFIPTDDQQLYQRLFTTSKAIEIEVLPLPNNEHSPHFSGIYTPAELTASINPSNSIQIGQLLEIEINLKTDTPSTFLELPKLNEQPDIDERFLVTGDFGKVWHDGSTSFKQRIRILSTTIQHIPPLHFKLFNPDSGHYETVNTPTIPLEVKPYKNQNTISLKSLNATQPLLSNTEGIWYNYPQQPMNDVFQSLLQCIDKYFWLILLVVLAVTALLVPVLRELRKRALNPNYQLQRAAYKKFRQTPATNPQKWELLLAWLAAHFQSNKKAWTYSDTYTALKKLKADQSDLETLATIHQLHDQAIYTQEKPSPDYKQLNNIAKRLAKLLPLILFCSLISANTIHASSIWQQAEQNFQLAQEKNKPQLYAQAALQFEESAKNNTRPTTSWYNAGNAWFQAGEIGRSIVAYRHAQQLDPLDKNIEQNLSAARTLVANGIPLTQSWWDKIPLIGLKTLTLLLSLIFAVFLLIKIRCDNKRLTKCTLLSGIILLSFLATTTVKIAQQKPQGVITNNKVVAKKGPSYAYASAFDSSLKDGLEFTLLETRNNWHLIQLQDKRQCWIPTSQATLIQ